MRKQAVPQGTMAGSSGEEADDRPREGNEEQPDAAQDPHVVAGGQPDGLLGGSGFFAPRFCPTSVAAALLRPQEGRSAKTITRNPIV